MASTSPRALFPLALALCALSGPGLAASEGGEGPAEAPRDPGFNRDIRPLLSDRCFPCHGPDAGARQAGLRLDLPEALDFEHDGIRALVPHDPEESELVRRILSDDPAEVMPPPGSGLSLSEEEAQLLGDWVAAGAEYEPHWAFVPPVEPELPAAGPGARTPIDHFIEARLAEVGLEPSPDAAPETLARRVYLDLLGLPPSPEQLDAFEADHARSGDAAYEALVDRLLATPQHAERLAQVWLDAARYADTNGFHHDNVRTAWPWRDWVLEAFRSNKPYDEFVVEQLAGDLLPEATEQDRIATAFARMHNINDEGGAIDAEYRVEAIADRIETVATVFMGLTFNCARCHDHKYDPFTQEDYYSLYAFFNSVDERGVYGNNFEAARAYPARLMFRPQELERRIEAARAELQLAERALEAAAPAVASEQATFERELVASRGIQWHTPEPVSASSTAAGTELALQEDGSFLARGTAAARETHTLELRTAATGLRLLRLDALADPSLPEGRVGRAPNGNAVLNHVRLEVQELAGEGRTREVSFRWAWADLEQPNGDFDALNVLRPDGLGWAVAGHLREGGRTLLLVADEEFGYEGGSSLRVVLDYSTPYDRHSLGRVRVGLATAGAEVLGDLPTIQRDWFLSGPHPAETFDLAWDRDLGPEGLLRLDQREQVNGKGWSHQPGFVDGVVHSLSGQTSTFYLARSIFTPVARGLDLSLGSDDALRVHLNGEEVLVNRVMRGAAADQDRLRVELIPGENVLVLEVVNNGGPGGFYYRSEAGPEVPVPLLPVALLPADELDPELRERYSTQWRRDGSRVFRELDDARATAAGELDRLEGEAVPVLVMKELEQPMETHVLQRGSYQLPDESRPVQRRTPRALPVAWPGDAPRDRLGFARWLVQDDHPLTARVHVNRLWQMVFGTGIVATTENFGLQAEWPSHPELLDWLAVRLVELDWDQRALLREIVTSSVYRQSARRDPVAAELDPDARLLSHFPRRRLPAENVRDLALSVSGLLVDDVGGPSVRPYQPDGLWREVSIGGSSNTQVFRRDEADALYRRSLYTFWKRTSPTPQMTLFDAPTREFCVVRRATTNTPLQALALWNDEQFVEAARALAVRTLREATGDAQRLERLFRRCTGRRPDREARAALLDLAADLEQRFAASPGDAEALLTVGESPAPTDLEPTVLATWTLVASTVLSLDETLVRD